MKKSRGSTPTGDSLELIRTRNDQANEIIHRTWATRSKDKIRMKTKSLKSGY